MENVSIAYGKGRRGINPNLVTSWDVDEKGYALIRFMGGSELSLQPDQWAEVKGAIEPSAAAASPAELQAGSPPTGV